MSLKNIIILSSALVAILALSPYTIVKLTSKGEEVENFGFSEQGINEIQEKIQQLEQKLAGYENQEEQIKKDIENTENQEAPTENQETESETVKNSSVVADQESGIDSENSENNEENEITQTETQIPSTVIQNDNEKGSSTDNQQSNISDGKKEEAAEKSFDPATAPSEISLRVLLKKNKRVPGFDVTVRFVGVGRESVEENIDQNGKTTTALETGRYYVEIDSENNDYTAETDSLPSFFLLPNKKIDLGTIYLIKN